MAYPTFEIDIRGVIATATSTYIDENEATFVGTDGIDGVDGTNGTDGSDGLDGADGVDGSNVTVSSIVNNGNGTMTVVFSDGFSHVTEDLQGPMGNLGATGVGIAQIRQISNLGYGESNTYGMDFTDGDTYYYDVENGDAIKSIVLTDWRPESGYENTYTVTMFSGTTFDFKVRNGEQGIIGETGLVPEMELVVAANGDVSFQVVGYYENVEYMEW